MPEQKQGGARRKALNICHLQKRKNGAVSAVPFFDPNRALYQTLH